MSATTWSKFFWSDWEADESLKLCSPGAQALWMRMLCVCAKADGYLMIAGQPLAAPDLARLTGWPLADVETWIDELRRWEVFSTDRAGKIYSRRIVREVKKGKTARENGGKGGNPNLRKRDENCASDNQDQTELAADEITNDPGARARINQKPEAISQIPEKSDDFFGAGQPAKPSRRKPEVTVPDGFPDERAKLEAREKARTEGKALDVEREADRFRDHAAANDRRARDWSAAWRMWISKALERAPASHSPTPTPSAGRIIHIGDREIVISADDPHATWKIRMVELTRNRFWRDLDWGARPTREAPQREGVQVPDEILTEFGFPSRAPRSAA